MLIDWFTVGAQAVNFLILVWLMKRYLYTPILNAIDAREKLIAAELADAATKKNEAKEDRDEFQAKNDKFDEQRAELLKKANDEAKAELERLLGEADKAADALGVERHEALLKDARSLNKAIRERTEQEVFAIVRKALSDLASVSLEECMADVLISRFDDIDDKTKEKIAAALKNSTGPAVVRSAFVLPTKQRTAIEDSVNKTFSAEIHIRFETEPDLISGIELIANGQKVAWSISDYLTSLEDGVNEILKRNEVRTTTATERKEAKSKAKAKSLAGETLAAKKKKRDKPDPKPKKAAGPKARPKSNSKAGHTSKKDNVEKVG